MIAIMNTIQSYASAFLIIASVTLVFIVTAYGWIQLIARDSRVAVASTPAPQCVVPAGSVQAGMFGGTTGGNFTFPAAVGIGTTNPQSRLDINDTSLWRTLTVRGSGGTDAVVVGNFGGRATIGAHAGALNAWAPLAINWDGAGGFGNVFMGGNVGIRTTNPTTTLDVDGRIRARFGTAVFSQHHACDSAGVITFNSQCLNRLCYTAWWGEQFFIGCHTGTCDRGRMWCSSPIAGRLVDP